MRDETEATMAVEAQTSEAVITASQDPALHSTVQRSGAAISCELGDEFVVLHLASGIYFGLGAVGSRIWKLIQTPASISQITGALLSEYAIDAANCERSVLHFVQQLSSKGLVEIS
jgi:hypothetical protein